MKDKLTDRQKEVLRSMGYSKDPVHSGHDGSILRALQKKSMVLAHSFAQGQNTYYTWTLTDAGQKVADELVAQERINARA